MPTRQDYLNLLFSDVYEFFELTYIAGDKTRADLPTFAQSYRLHYERPNWQQVADLNQRGYGVYYGLCPKRKRPAPGKRAHELDASLCQVLWADIDLKDGHYASKPEAIKAAADFPLLPSSIIDTGGGVHAIWRIKPVVVSTDSLPVLKATLRGIAQYLKSDPSVAELARVFRLPDTVNTKPDRDNALCHLIEDYWTPGWTYELEDFAPYAEPIRDQRPIRRNLPVPKPDRLTRYLEDYLDTAHVSGTRNNSLNMAAYHMHSNGYSEADAHRLLTPRALADGLGEAEIERTIRSAFAAAPGTPSYITPALFSRIRASEAQEEPELQNQS